MKKALLSASVSLLFVFHSARAAETGGISGANLSAAQTPQWVEQNRYEYVHFNIVSAFKDDEYGQRLLKDLETYFSMMQKEFWDFIPPQNRESRISIIAFDNQAAFDEFAERDGGVPRGEKGYSNGRARKIVYLRQDLYYKDITILVHEMTHIFNSFCAGETPVWLDEGMAQYYANYAGERSGNTNVKSGVVPDTLRRLDAALKNGSFAHVSELLIMPDDVFYGAQSPVNYAQAWALAYYLRRGMADGDARFAEYYLRIVRGRDSYTAFTETYGASLPLFRDLWLKYLEGLYRDNVGPAPKMEVFAR